MRMRTAQRGVQRRFQVGTCQPSYGFFAEHVAYDGHYLQIIAEVYLVILWVKANSCLVRLCGPRVWQVVRPSVAFGRCACYCKARGGVEQIAFAST